MICYNLRCYHFKVIRIYKQKMQIGLRDFSKCKINNIKDKK
jgi:hypothetical protein